MKKIKFNNHRNRGFFFSQTKRTFSPFLSLCRRLAFLIVLELHCSNQSVLNKKFHFFLSPKTEENRDKTGATGRFVFRAFLSRLFRIEKTEHVRFSENNSRTRREFDCRVKVNFFPVNVTHRRFAARFQMNDVLTVLQNTMFRFDVGTR